MKKIRSINKRQTVLTTSQMKDCIRHNSTWVHESVLRAYWILEEVKKMLERWDSKETIMWIIDEMEYKEDLPPQLNTSNNP